MTTRLRNATTSSTEGNMEPLNNVVEFDGQSYLFGPNAKRTFLNDGIANSLVSYSATDRVLKDAGDIGMTEESARS